MDYNLAAIRQLVSAAFSDDELKDFCFDRFPTVYQDFTAGQTQGQRVLLLVDFAARQGQLGVLLDTIIQANPYQYERFEASLHSEGGQPALGREPFEPVSILTPAGAKIDTGGGAFVSGNVNTGGGDLIGRDKIVNTTTIVVSTPEQAVTAAKQLQQRAELLQPVLKTKPFEPKTILIPAGSFLMGTDDLAAPLWEQPQHPMNLPDFRIGKYPVTMRQYAEFIKQVKSQDPPDDPGWFLRQPPAGRLDHPVAGVSWLDAVAYCRWLSGQTGLTYRLPSEAEWEKAASWGGGDRERGREGEGERKRRYPWGEEWGEGRCNAGGSGTTAVTAHRAGASAFGVEDLLGNVQEWTRSLWGSRPQQPDSGYPYDPGDGREVSDAASLPAQARLVHRGGSFKSQPADLRCTARGNATPDSKVAWRGCRVAMEV